MYHLHRTSGRLHRYRAWHTSDARFREFDHQQTNARYGDSDQGYLFFARKPYPGAYGTHLYEVDIHFEQAASTNCLEDTDACSYICTCYRRVFDRFPEIQVVFRSTGDGLDDIITREPALIEIIKRS